MVWVDPVEQIVWIDLIDWQKNVRLGKTQKGRFYKTVVRPAMVFVL